MKHGWLILALFVVVSTTAGFRPKTFKRSDYATSGFKIVNLGDPHFGLTVGDNDYGMERAEKVRDYVNADDSVAVVILTGDMTWANEANRDTLLSWITSIKKPILPIVGNWEWSADDTGTGKLYDAYTSHWPTLYAPYRNTNQRGKRWGGMRLEWKGSPTNCLIVWAQNNRDTTGVSGNYRPNNPNNSSGLSNTDFDGISDSTSTQRQDIQNFLRRNYAAGDWVVLVWHRASRGICDNTIRPTSLEDVYGDADKSLITWLDSFVDGNFIVIEGDQHQNTIFDAYRSHYVLAACMMARNADRTRLARWSSSLLAMAMNDTCYPETGTVADSIGVDGQTQDLDGPTTWRYWNTINEIVPNGTSASLRLVLFQSGPDATCPIFYTEATQ